MKEKLMHKGVKAVRNIMSKNGYIVSCDYEDGDNYIVEFSKTAAGTTIKSVTVVFSQAWRVIEVR